MSKKKQYQWEDSEAKKHTACSRTSGSRPRPAASHCEARQTLLGRLSFIGLRPAIRGVVFGNLRPASCRVSSNSTGTMAAGQAGKQKVPKRIGSTTFFLLVTEAMSSATDEVAALRSKIVQLELKHQIHRMAQRTELEKIKMQVALEKKDQKMELMEIKMQAASEKKDLEQKMELEKRDREADKRETQLKWEARVGQIEQQLENEERDREADKRETQHQIENEKRDRLLENEKRDREADKRQTQLKWEARVGRLEQQLHTMQPLNNPVQNTARLNLAQQTANEELVLERLQLRLSERREKETGSSHPIASPAAVQVQAATQHSTAAPALLPSATRSSAPTGSTNVLAARPFSTRPVDTGVLQQEQRQPAAVPRQQVATGPEPARTAAVALPSDARMHFFLSHCQGTGGDQTNAIYLELRQLGFACWYSALVFDLLLLTHTFLPS
jgi:hypothetical protein